MEKRSTRKRVEEASRRPGAGGRSAVGTKRVGKGGEKQPSDA
jgi:hypothetical protein